MGYNDDAPAIVNANEPHMACLLLLDTSSSMHGEAIESLNAGINKFKEEVCKDERTRNIVDIAIVEFNTNVKVVQTWTPIEYMEPVNLQANGGTDMVRGLREAIDMVRERSRFYLQATGTVPYKPWIVMITDGYPNESIDNIAEEIAELDEKGKLRLWSLAVENADTKILNKLCGGKRVLKLQGKDFTEFFDWIHKSARSISQSAPGEKAQGVPLPDTVDKAIDDDWM